MTYGNARSLLNTSGFGNPSTPTETSRTSCPLTESSFIACHHVSLRLRDLQSLPFVLLLFSAFILHLFVIFLFLFFSIRSCQQEITDTWKKKCTAIDLCNWTVFVHLEGPTMRYVVLQYDFEFQCSRRPWAVKRSFKKLQVMIGCLRLPSIPLFCFRYR